MIPRERSKWLIATSRYTSGYCYFWRSTRTHYHVTKAPKRQFSRMWKRPEAKRVCDGVLSVNIYAKTNSSAGLDWKLSKVRVTRSSTSVRDNCFCSDNQRELGDRCWENINCYRCTVRYYNIIPLISGGLYLARMKRRIQREVFFIAHRNDEHKVIIAEWFDLESNQNSLVFNI